MTPGRSALLLALGLLAAACGGSRSSRELSRLGASCIVIVLDAAAAGHFSTYGHVNRTTPVIDRLASEGTAFTRAYSQSPSTVVSVPSFFSGLYPQTINQLRSGDDKAHPLRFVRPTLDPEPTTWLERVRHGARPQLLAQAFHAAGFRTAAFSENPYVGPAFDLDTGFDHFVEIDPLAAGDQGSRFVVENALNWMQENHDARVFVYMHLLRPHTPYTPPPPLPQRFRPRWYQGTLVADVKTVEAIDRGLLPVTPDDVAYIRSQYDANLFYADQLVGLTLESLRRMGILERSLLVVMADHGEAFGQHGRFLHNSTLYEEMVRVPFIFRLPTGVGTPGSRVAAPVGLVDLFPTLAELFALPDGRVARTEGRSLVPLLEDAGARWPRPLVFSQRLASVAAIAPDFKYIVEPGAAPGAPAQHEELYALADDPEERQNAAAAHPDTIAAMRKAVTGFVGTRAAAWSVDAAAPSLSEEKREQLRALGYVH